MSDDFPSNFVALNILLMCVIAIISTILYAHDQLINFLKEIYVVPN